MIQNYAEWYYRQVFDVFSERSIAENNKWSIQKRYRNGKFKIGYTPYGYDNVDGKMVVNPEQAATVRWIFEVVLSGMSPGTVAKRLNEKGIRKDEDKYKNRYAMSGKIICGECGDTWKRVKLNGHFGFACNTHVRDEASCSMKSILEDPVKAAFGNRL